MFTGLGRLTYIKVILDYLKLTWEKFFEWYKNTQEKLEWMNITWPRKGIANESCHLSAFTFASTIC